VGSIGRRVRRLEEVCRLSSGNDNPVEREKRRAAFVETFERAWERAERERPGPPVRETSPGVYE
jgi:hypothetical protein